MTEQKNPVKAIRAYCLNCCLESANEVRNCPAEDCQLWHFRMGKNPYRTKREMSEEQKAAAVERLRLAKERKTEENG